MKELNVLSVKVSEFALLRSTSSIFFLILTYEMVYLSTVRFLDPTNGGYIGPVMVAKESRFVGEYQSTQTPASLLRNDVLKNTYQTQMAYHKNFMRTQNIAANFGRRFNDALDMAEEYFDTASRAFLRGLPRIHFIEPMVVEVRENEVEKNILIERYLVGEYKKVRTYSVRSCVFFACISGKAD